MSRSPNSGSRRQFSRVLVANRGEIALRIMRAARQLGLETVAVHTAAEAAAPHVRRADHTIVIDSPAGYRDAQALVNAAIRSGAQAVHPGYGFLSESAEFAQQCIDAGLRFVGPSPASIRLMGDKSAARRAMAGLGLPVIPGYDGEGQSDAVLHQEAEKIGVPLMIKACAGGGGRGMRRVERLDDFPAALSAARSEALAAFGDPSVLLEQALDHARHIEIQVLADMHGTVIALGERDCSVQRRHQKLVEESPSPALDPARRLEIEQRAVAAVRMLGYEGAGTLEFLLASDGRLLFMEMNTRLQVEHPVTEAIYGVDIVQWQFRIAAGARLDTDPMLSSPSPIGHALEVRLCAEDPARGFIPQSGVIRRWNLPAGVRIEHALHDGAEISPDYDSMIARLVTHGPDREAARRSMLAALGELEAFGVRTNRDFLIRCLRHPEFTAGDVDTGFVERHGNLLTGVDESARSRFLLLGACLLRASPKELSGASLLSMLPVPLRLECSGERSTFRVERQRPGHFWVTTDGARTECILSSVHPEDTRAHLDGEAIRIRWWRGDGELWMSSNDLTVSIRDVSLRQTAKRARGSDADGSGGELRSPMNARVVRVQVSAGDRVAEGAALLSLEAMKIEHQLVAPIAGRVTRVEAAAGGLVSQGDRLLVIKPDQP